VTTAAYSMVCMVMVEKIRSKYQSCFSPTAAKHISCHHTHPNTRLYQSVPSTSVHYAQPQSEVTALIVSPCSLYQSVPFCALHLHPLHINHSQKSPYFLLALICTLHLPLPWPTAHQHQWRQTGKGIREP